MGQAKRRVGSILVAVGAHRAPASRPGISSHRRDQGECAFGSPRLPARRWHCSAFFSLLQPSSTFAHIQRRAPASLPSPHTGPARGQTAAHGVARSLRRLPPARVAADMRSVRGRLRCVACRHACAMCTVRDRVAAADVGGGRNECDNLPHPNLNAVRTVLDVPSGIRRGPDARRLRRAAGYIDDSSEIPWCIAAHARIRRTPRRGARGPLPRSRNAAVGARAASGLAAGVARFQSGMGADACRLAPGASAVQRGRPASRTDHGRAATPFPRRASTEFTRCLRGRRARERSPHRIDRRRDDHGRDLRRSRCRT